MIKISEIQNFRVGEIRKIRSMQNGGKSRLVLIAELDQKDCTALVFLLNNMTETAIPRDLILTKKNINAHFDLVLMSEYFSRVDLTDLDQSKIIGQISEGEIQRIRKLTFEHPFGQLPSEIETDGMKIGKYPVQKYDAIWNFRSLEFDNFQLLSFTRNQLSSEYVARILSLHPDLSAIIDDCPLDALFLVGRERVGA